MMALVPLVIVMLAREKNTQLCVQGHNSYPKFYRNWKGTSLGQKIELGAEEWNSMLAFN